jgi:hypothetical protein
VVFLFEYGRRSRLLGEQEALMQAITSMTHLNDRLEKCWARCGLLADSTQEESQGDESPEAFSDTYEDLHSPFAISSDDDHFEDHVEDYEPEDRL